MGRLVSCTFLAVIVFAASTLAGPASGKINPALTSKLVELIAKKRYDDFTSELAVDGMDPNQPDSKGRLPLMEAVRSKDIRFVDALIQFGAVANSKDPATGSAPIQLAFQSAQADIARLLLAYGADINGTDKSGKKPRDFQPTMDIANLVKQHDAHGALAFEDAPGIWIRSTTDSGDQKYWFNTKTQEARWNTPPSCAWQRIQYQGQPNKYVNYVTTQAITKRPPALCWRLLRQNDQDVWYNWASNHSQVTPPDEVPEDMLQEAKELKNVRWYNPTTGEFSWEDPRWHTPWRVVKEEFDERPYYFNVITGESSWEAPEELAWQEVESTEHQGRKFWYNSRTGESTWDVPNPWEKHASDL